VLFDVALSSDDSGGVNFPVAGKLKQKMWKNSGLAADAVKGNS
jgi:hypothetical protein